MISQTAEYALRAVIFLADSAGEAHTADKISAATKVPVGYLSKILQGLARAGLVRSQRGPYGGFTLAAEQTKLTIFEVVEAVDPIRRITSCPLELHSHGANLCPLHRTLDNAMASVERIFRKVTVESLLAERGSSSRPLCDFPRHDSSQAEPVRRSAS